jgi:DNA-binding response OmpR family regulator
MNAENKIKVLSVDDIYTNNKVIEFDLETYASAKGFSFEFFSFTDPEEALNKIKQEKDIDIVFLDIMMPKKSGFDVLKEIRECKEIKQPFVVIVTALNDEKQKQKAIELGADAYISKPYDYREIHAVLDLYFGTSEEEHGEVFWDFDEFADFEDVVSEKDKEKMKVLNMEHSRKSAKEFFSELKNDLTEEQVDEMIEEAEELKREILTTIPLYGMTLKEELPNIKKLISGISNFLNFLGEEFETISRIIYEDVISTLNEELFDRFDERELDKLAMYISSILEDIANWLDEVFIKQEAIDINYITASLYNSLIEVRKLLGRNGQPPI